jgi:putative Mn2+ efflux pump MntP
MDFITILLIAIGLSFDTFAVSVSTGLVICSIRFWQGVRVAFILAFFQSLMPFLGWFAGKQVATQISDYDHWIAFGLLAVLGLKMIVESFKKEEQKTGVNPLKITILLGMAVATSIDALVVGVSFAFLEMKIYLSVLIIGIVTFLVSMIGMLFGKSAGGRFGRKMEIIGGLILIGIGIKILLEHLQFN